MPKLIYKINLVLIIFSVHTTKAYNNNDVCVRSFEHYAYEAPRHELDNIYLPEAPWQFESSISDDAIIPFDGRNFFRSYVLMSRILDNKQEIWISGIRGQIGLTYIYHVDTKEWEIIEASIEKLFTTQDGQIWGQTLLAPFLARFDEVNRTFEPVDVILGDSFGHKILLDDKDVFWIFMSYDAIYRYDTQSNHRIAEMRFGLQNRFVEDAILTPDGNIIFEVDSDKGQYIFFIPPGSIYQFSSQPNEISELQLPESPIPFHLGMLADHLGRIWFGASAYRDVDMTWHIIHPDVDGYLEYANSGNMTYIWAPPSPILESSDGRLWYTRFAENRTVDGMAWYNPETGDGCQFTNISSKTIIEDDLQQIWVIVDNNLYKYSLNSE